MSEILDELDTIASQSCNPFWSSPAIRKFVETGDESQFKLIPSLPDTGAITLLAFALPDLGSMTEEALRVLKLAHVKGLDSILEYYVSRYCDSEGGQLARISHTPSGEGVFMGAGRPGFAVVSQVGRDGQGKTVVLWTQSLFEVVQRCIFASHNRGLPLAGSGAWSVWRAQGLNARSLA